MLEILNLHVKLWPNEKIKLEWRYLVEENSSSGCCKFEPPCPMLGVTVSLWMGAFGWWNSDQSIPPLADDVDYCTVFDTIAFNDDISTIKTFKTVPGSWIWWKLFSGPQLSRGHKIIPRCVAELHRASQSLTEPPALRMTRSWLSNSKCFLHWRSP